MITDFRFQQQTWSKLSDETDEPSTTKYVSPPAPAHDTKEILEYGLGSLLRVPHDGRIRLSFDLRWLWKAEKSLRRTEDPPQALKPLSGEEIKRPKSRVDAKLVQIPLWSIGGRNNRFSSPVDTPESLVSQGRFCETDNDHNNYSWRRSCAYEFCGISNC